jgi:hypothetical protein
MKKNQQPKKPKKIEKSEMLEEDLEKDLNELSEIIAHCIIKEIEKDKMIDRIKEGLNKQSKD